MGEGDDEAPGEARTPAIGPWRRREAFFGRVKGQRLGPRQEACFETLLPRLRLDLSGPAPADLASLFAEPVGAVRLEIGFGGGEHLRHEAARHPGTGFIGVEPFVNAMAKMLGALDEAPRGNLRLFDDDAVLILDWLPPESLAGVDLFYADPWPKKKHYKRRFVSARNLARIHRVLKPGALFRFASDIDTYVNWTLAHVAAFGEASGGGFEWTARRAADWHSPYEAWPGTRYEAKAIREGRRPAYLSFRRL